MKNSFHCCTIRVVANGWEIDATSGYRFREDDARMAENTFVFNSFEALSKWIKENIKPVGE